MSRIAFVVEDFGPSKAKAVSTIRQQTGLPFSQIVERVREGFPVLDRRLFFRDHSDVAKAILRLADELSALGAEFVVFQSCGSEPFTSHNVDEYKELTVGKLRNILAAHDQELQQQRGLAFLEAEDDER